MKSFSIHVQLLMQALVFTMFISACGASQATPTSNVVDIQNTMVAVGLTMLSETQVAIPTATSPPPTATLTNTPAPTATLPLLLTLEATITAAPVGISGADDPCIHQVMPASLDGETIKIRVDNPMEATLILSVNLQQAGPQTQCGYRIYNLAPGDSLVINDLVVGCYTLWAWNPDPDEYFISTNGTSCLDTSNTWTFDISTSSIRLRP